MEKYVISGELDLPINDNDPINQEEILNFRTSLDNSLRAVGKNTEWVDSYKLRVGLCKLISKSSLPVISLDRRYVNNAVEYLDLSRAVDGNLKSCGYTQRVSADDIDVQIDKVSKKFNQIVLADDVVFSGDNILRLVDSFSEKGVKVAGVLAGIAIGEGYNKINDKKIPVETVEYYEQVDDEICERDFAVVPGSGRRVVGSSDGSKNSLYFDIEYGNPNWASIPTESEEEKKLAKLFCINSLLRSKKLLRNGVFIQQVGNFYGYDKEGLAEHTIAKRLLELERGAK